MKDYTINGLGLRFDNGTQRIIRESRGIEFENPLDGLIKWEDMAPWILLGGIKRHCERAGILNGDGISSFNEMIDDFSPSETVELINAYVKAVSISVDGDMQSAGEGQAEKKS